MPPRNYKLNDCGRKICLVMTESGMGIGTHHSPGRPDPTLREAGCRRKRIAAFRESRRLVTHCEYEWAQGQLRVRTRFFRILVNASAALTGIRTSWRHNWSRECSVQKVDKVLGQRIANHSLTYELSSQGSERPLRSKLVSVDCEYRGLRVAKRLLKSGAQ